MKNDAAESRLREVFYGVDGYSCAQVTLIVLREVYGIDSGRDISQGYALGGGIGHTGHGWCGGLLGGAMAVGELCADRLQDPSTIAQATWPIVQDLYDAFVGEFGHAGCMDLLGFSIRGEQGEEQYRLGDCKERICFRNLLFVIQRLLPLVEGFGDRGLESQGAKTMEGTSI
jgi:hypothetical protein